MSVSLNAGLTIPALVSGAGARVARRFLEFFTVEHAGGDAVGMGTKSGCCSIRLQLPRVIGPWLVNVAGDSVEFLLYPKDVLTLICPVARTCERLILSVGGGHPFIAHTAIVLYSASGHPEMIHRASDIPDSTVS
jgi:hypothetical protein